MNKLKAYYMMYNRRLCKNGMSHFYCVAENEDLAQEIAFTVYHAPCHHIVELRSTHFLSEKLFHSGKHGYIGSGPDYIFHVYVNREDKINNLLS